MSWSVQLSWASTSDNLTEAKARALFVWLKSQLGADAGNPLNVSVLLINGCQLVESFNPDGQTETTETAAQATTGQ